MSQSNTEQPAESNPSDTGRQTATPSTQPAADASFQPDVIVQQPPRSGGVGWALALAFIALLAAGGSLWWQYQSVTVSAVDDELPQQLAALSEQLDQVQQNANEQSQTWTQRLTGLEATQQTQAASIEQLRTQLATPDPALSSMGSQLSALSQDVQSLTRNIVAINAREANAEREAILAEVEYLLSIAAARARLAADADGAVAALSMADQRLAALNDPLVGEVREQLQIETDALRQASTVDPLAIAGQLSSLSMQVMDWPLKGTMTDQQPDDGDVQEASLSEQMMALLDELIVVRPANDFEPQMVDTNAQVLIRLNLSSSLAAARLAALRGDASRLEQELSAAIDWIDRFFAVDAAQVSTARETLQALAATDLSNRLPQPVTSLRLLRALRESALDAS